jgi:hypothetical protein
VTARKVRGVVKLDLADNGSGRPVDCAAVAKVLTRSLAPPATAAMLKALAAALRSGVVAVKIDTTVAEADAIRDALIAAYQGEIDGRRGAADLAYLRRAWEDATGFADRPPASARAAPRPVR